MKASPSNAPRRIMNTNRGSRSLARADFGSMLQAAKAQEACIRPRRVNRLFMVSSPLKFRAHEEQRQRLRSGRRARHLEPGLLRQQRSEQTFGKRGWVAGWRKPIGHKAR